ncbi:MAG: Asparagine synthetase, partial [Labilithrix sp.]|nr:Asparagine synthetase [Labilithrix sp.]
MSAVRSPFVFCDGSGARSERLDQLPQLTRGRALDVDDLADRLLLAPPRRAEQTPYLDIRAVAREAVPASAAPEREVDVAPERAIAALRIALESSVGSSIADARRVAVLTGGGVDSSALLALAVAHMRKVGGSAFGVALDFAGPGDDRPHREALARHLGCEILRVAPEDAAQRFTDGEVGIDAAPLTWPGAALEIEAITRARAHGAEAVLTGVGADELFDGDPRSLARVARRGRILDATRKARALRGFERPASPALAWVARPLLAAA